MGFGDLNVNTMLALHTSPRAVSICNLKYSKLHGVKDVLGTTLPLYEAASEHSLQLIADTTK
eukprot:1034165-Amphidinium_carterae.1